MFSLCGSLLSKLTGLQPGPIAPIASAATIGFGFVAIFEPILRTKEKRSIPLLGVAFFGSAAVEIIGISTGLPFGTYAYTDAWKPVADINHHNFPILLPFAWLLIVGASITLCNKFRQPILCGALLATAIDAIMEPVMTGPLAYWHWNPKGPLPGGASLLNPIGWFATSLIVGLLLKSFPLNQRRIAATVLAGHLLLTFGIGAISMIAR